MEGSIYKVPNVLILNNGRSIDANRNTDQISQSQKNNRRHISNILKANKEKHWLLFTDSKIPKIIDNER